MGVELSPSALQAIFAVMDSSDDGAISADEFIAYVWSQRFERIRIKLNTVHDYIPNSLIISIRCMRSNVGQQVLSGLIKGDGLLVSPTGIQVTDHTPTKICMFSVW